MNKAIRLTLLCLASSSAPAFAQNVIPPCGTANFDQSRHVFTVMSPVANAVNQQCLLTVYANGSAPEQARQFPSLYPREGTYVIELSGGGGGGGGGAAKDQGGCCGGGFRKGLVSCRGFWGGWWGGWAGRSTLDCYSLL